MQSEIFDGKGNNFIVNYDNLIFYNIYTNRSAAIKRNDTDDLLVGVVEKIEGKSKSTAKNEKNSPKLQKFKRVSLGGALVT